MPLSGIGWASARRWKINTVHRDGSQEAHDARLRQKVGRRPCTLLKERDRSIASKQHNSVCAPALADGDWLIPQVILEPPGASQAHST